MSEDKDAGQPIGEEPPADLDLPEETAAEVKGGMPQGPPNMPVGPPSIQSGPKPTGTPWNKN
jgi:hypothetical protein